jgi:hypothetical protein
MTPLGAMGKIVKAALCHALQFCRGRSDWVCFVQVRSLWQSEVGLVTTSRMRNVPVLVGIWGGRSLDANEAATVGRRGPYG